MRVLVGVFFNLGLLFGSVSWAVHSNQKTEAGDQQSQRLAARENILNAQSVNDLNINDLNEAKKIIREAKALDDCLVERGTSDEICKALWMGQFLN